MAALAALTMLALATQALTGASGAAAAAVAPAAAVRPAARIVGTASTVGKLVAWGDNFSGDLGDGTATVRAVPVKVKLPRSTKVTQIRAGCEHTLALTSSGQVLAWGNNHYGQLGNGSTSGSYTPVKVKIPRGTKITAVRAGCEFSVALTSKGQVLAWGQNELGQLGDGTTLGRHRPVAVKLPRLTKVTAISIGAAFALARTATGQVLAWGDNFDGQLGNGTTAASDTPVRVKLPARAKVTMLAGGGYHGLALTSAGLFAWGDNGEGELGDGTNTSSDKPVKVVFPLRRGRPLGHMTGLFAGCEHSLALFSGGAVLAWGDNLSGELGDGTTTSRSEPVGVIFPAGTRVRAIGATCVDSYALTASGHVLAWGQNTVGELGDGSTTGSSTPVRVDLPSGWRASALGTGPAAAHALAIVYK